MIVIDANVAVKWYLPEVGSQGAVALQEGPDHLIAPDLIRMEVAAAITKRVRAEKKEERLSPEEALNICARWLGLVNQDTVISLVPEEELIERAVKLSAEIKHNLQDCMYLAVAKGLDAPLITADRTFHERALRFYKHISILPGCEKN